MRYEVRLHARPVWQLAEKSTALGKVRETIQVIDAQDDREAMAAAKPLWLATQIAATGITEPAPAPGATGRLRVRYLGHGTPSLLSWMTTRGLMVLVPTEVSAEAEGQSDLDAHARGIGREQADEVAGRVRVTGPWPPPDIPFDALELARPLLGSDAKASDIRALAELVQDAAKARWDELAKAPN